MKTPVFLILAILVLPGPTLFAAAHSNEYAAFFSSWKCYEEMVSRDAGINQRETELRLILHRHWRNIPKEKMPLVLAELRFINSWRFYKKQVAAGAGRGTRLNTLARIKQKYEGKVVDFSPVEKEYALLKGAPRTASTPALPVVTAPATLIDEAFCNTAAPAPVAEIPEQVIETPLPAQPATEKRRAKHIGICGQGLGIAGLYGYQGIANITNRFSIAALCGRGDMAFSAPGEGAEISADTRAGFLRYGRNVYAATGFISKTMEGKAIAGTVTSAGTISTIGIPLIIGIETGSKRGIFFTVEWAYVFYAGDPSRTLTAADPFTGASAECHLEAPESGTWFGIGLGFYLF